MPLHIILFFVSVFFCIVGAYMADTRTFVSWLCWIPLALSIVFMLLGLSYTPMHTKRSINNPQAVHASRSATPADCMNMGGIWIDPPAEKEQ